MLCLRPFYVSAKGCDTLELSGIPPGLFSASNYESVAIPIKPGDSVFCFTDGLTDAADAFGEQLGIERLRLACMENRCAAPREILEKIFDALDSFSGECEQNDDMAAAVFHYSE